MGIADFFRPKYRHSDVRVRTEAVKALGKDDAAILIQVAKSDRDLGVRRLAIEKIDEADALADIAAAESERSIRDFAGERAAKLWMARACGGDADKAGAALAGIIKIGDQYALVDIVARAEQAAIKKKAFVEIRDPRALAELAKREGAAEYRFNAVTRIDDGDVLRALAIDTTAKEVGLAAVEKLDDLDRLENVADKAKNKAVRQKARKIVTEIKEAERVKKPGVPDEVKRRRAEKAQLVREIEALAETFEFAKASEQVRAAEAAWAAIAAVADEGDERFVKAVARFWKRKEVYEQQARSGDELRAIERQALEDKARAAAERAAKAAAAGTPVAPEAPGLTGEDARSARPDAPKPRRDRDAPEDGDVVNAAAMAIMTAADQKARAAREAEAKERREERDRSRAEDDARRAARDADRAARDKDNAEKGAVLSQTLDALVAEMEALVDVVLKDTRHVDRLLQQAGKAFDQIGKVAGDKRDALADRYTAARGKLVIKVQELREAEDWVRWNNVPKAEALIATAKEMAAGEATPDLGNRLRGLQALWKEVGPMPQRRSKELWDLFKVACDAVYEKVRGERAVAAEKFGEVAKAKEALIAEAEALAKSITDEDAKGSRPEAFAATAEKLKQLQQAWKTSGHLPRKQGDDLWKRFRAACDTFFARRKPMLDARAAEEGENLAKKHALIARANAVADGAPGTGGWGKAIAEVKQLQLQWKEIGYVPRRDADAVYKSFRAACDRLFAKRDEARDGEANAHRAELAAIELELAAVINAEASPELVARAIAARDKASEHDAFGPLVAKMIAHVVTTHAALVKGTELDPAQLRARRDKLIARAEELLPKQAAAPAATDVAQQLKAAMQKNAFGDLRFSGRDPGEVVDELVASWADAGPFLDDTDRAQTEKFDATVAKVLEAIGRTPSRRRSDRPDVAAAVPQVTHDAITAPASGRENFASSSVIVPPPVAATPAPAPAAPARARTPSIVPQFEAQDAGWDLGEDDPTSAEPEKPPAEDPRTSTPSSSEMAGDGATEGDGLDAGWD